MYSVDEMMQILMTNDKAYSYCCQYFIDDLIDPAFEEFLCMKIEQGKTEREVIAEYMAAWIPWEENADQLIARVRELGRSLRDLPFSPIEKHESVRQS